MAKSPILNLKIALPIIFAASALSVFVFVPVLSQSNSFDFASDVTPAQTTTIKVMGIGSMSIEPDSVIISLESYSPPTNNLSDVFAYQKSLSDELREALETASESADDYKITSYANRINVYQLGTADPSQSRYTVDFRIPAKVQYERFDQLFADLVEQGFAIDDIKIIEAPVDELTPTGSVIASIPSGTSTPGCEVTPSCYEPYELDVNVGTTVTWINDDSAAHTITSGTPEGGPDGFFDSGLIMAGAKFSHTFYQPGQIDYFCIVHPWMLGKVAVSNGDLEGPVETTLFVDFVVISQSSADTVQNTLDYYKEKTDALVLILEGHGVSTDEIQQRPVRLDDRVRSYSEPAQFEMREYLVVQTKMENVEKVFEIAADKNARINDIYYSYSDSALDLIRPQLAQLALDDAKKNVLELIAGSGLQIKGIKSVEINTSAMVDDRFDGQIQRGLFVSADRYDQSRDQIYAKAEVEFEVGR